VALRRTIRLAWAIPMTGPSGLRWRGSGRETVRLRPLPRLALYPGRPRRTPLLPLHAARRAVHLRADRPARRRGRLRIGMAERVSQAEARRCLEAARWHRQQLARLGSRATDEERERVGLLEWYYYGDARRVGLPTGRGSCAVGGGPEAPLEPVDGGREPVRGEVVGVRAFRVGAWGWRPPGARRRGRAGRVGTSRSASCRRARDGRRRPARDAARGTSSTRRRRRPGRARPRCRGCPQRVGWGTATAPGGLRQPLVRRSWIRRGVMAVVSWW